MCRFLAVLLLLAVPAAADDLPPVADAHVYSGAPTTNFGKSIHLFLSADCCPRRFYRAYLRFDLSRYPQGTQVARAELHWYQWGGGGAGCLPANLHRVTGPWTETAITWNTKPPHDAQVVASVCVGNIFAKGWKVWPMTTVVNGWLAGTWANYGVVIKDPTESSAGAGRVGKGYSREYTDPTKRPFLRLYFAWLTRTGTPRIGTTFTWNLAAPNDPLRPYQCASAFGTQPGLRLGNRTIPLNPDPLFFLSLSVPAIFANYSGTLDSQGRGRAAVHVPNLPALVGLKFYTAFVTLRPGAPFGVGAISQAAAVTIQV